MSDPPRSYITPRNARPAPEEEAESKPFLRIAR
jgi:hypothetical protein